MSQIINQHDFTFEKISINPRVIPCPVIRGQIQSRPQALKDAMESPDLPAELLDFLPCPTPDAWVRAALERQDVLLLDHRNCELKAAATAMSLIARYG